MIAQIISDAKALEAETVRDEEEVTKAHKDFVKEMNAVIEAANEYIVMETKEKAQAEDDDAEAEGTLASVEQEVSSRRSSRVTTPGWRTSRTLRIRCGRRRSVSPRTSPTSRTR